MSQPYLHTPIHRSQHHSYKFDNSEVYGYSTKVLSPTTANSKCIGRSRSSVHLLDSVRRDIGEIITEVQGKREDNRGAVSAVYTVNQELKAEMEMQMQRGLNQQMGAQDRGLKEENEELRKDLNEALREIMRLNKVIRGLESENGALRAGLQNQQYREGMQLIRELNELRSEGEGLRTNVIKMLKSK